MEKQNKELDLIDLIKVFGNYAQQFVLWIWKAAKYFIRFNVKYFILIGTFTVLGIGLTVYKCLPQNMGQKANFIVQINAGKSYETADIVKELNLKLSYPQGNSALAKTLRLDSQTAKQIASFDTYFVIDINKDDRMDFVDFDNRYAKDTLPRRMHNYINIEVRTFKPVAIENIKKNIVDYLNSTPYLKNENEKRRQEFTERIKDLDYEIVMLDSMRKMEMKTTRPNYQLNVTDMGYWSNANNELHTFSLGNESKTYNEEMFAMQNKRIRLEQLLKFNPNAVETYSDGATIEAAYTISDKAVKYIVVFYSFGLFLALLWYYRKKIINFLKS